MNVNDSIPFIAYMPFLIPIIFFVIGIPCFVVMTWLKQKAKQRMFELHHQERMQAIERGMEVPPLPTEFFSNKKAHKNERKDSLEKGLFLLFVGIAIGVALLFNQPIVLPWGSPTTAAWALIPIAVGVAHLVYCFALPRIEGKATPEAPTTEPRS